ncbi:unnamed protein product [marine sediment metagenome]|uniref:Uncharacterized protein n=1 Tax=marine sediment metagenome TaxID=412755 RepID=X0VAT5_9ZZZZ
MANELLWLPKTVGDLLTTELNDLADATMVVDGADYDNATRKFRFASFFFFGTWDAACDAGALVELHLFYKLDGTNYGDGEDGDVFAAQGSGNSLHGLFQIGVQADAYQQVLGVPLQPFAFRAGIKMACGQPLTAVDTHWLKMYPYNEELQ